MNAYQICQLEPPAIETIVYSDSSSTELEVALSDRLLELFEYADDGDKQLETLQEQCDQFETDLDNETERLENKLDSIGELLYEMAEFVGIYENEEYSDISDSDKLALITAHLNTAKDKDFT